MNNRSGQSSLTMSHFQFVKCSENFPSSLFSKKIKTGEWNEFFIFHFFPPHFCPRLPRSFSPVALQTVLASSPTLIPAPLSVKSHHIPPWWSNNRTALPSIRIANPATHNHRTGEEEERVRATEQNDKMKKPYIKTVYRYTLLVWGM